LQVIVTKLELEHVSHNLPSGRWDWFSCEASYR